MTESTRKQKYAQHVQDEQQNIMLSISFIKHTILSLLTQVDQWERLAGISPRTSEIRKMYKNKSS